MVTEYQAELLTDIMIHTELWISKWDLLLESGYEPKQEFKFNANKFKGSLEKLQKQLFVRAKHQLPEKDYKEFELVYMNKVKEMELLLEEYLRGKVEVIEDKK